MKSFFTIATLLISVGAFAKGGQYVKCFKVGRITVEKKLHFIWNESASSIVLFNINDMELVETASRSIYENKDLCLVYAEGVTDQRENGRNHTAFTDKLEYYYFSNR